MRIGIYSRTFDPPHIGHIQEAEYGAKALALDKLLLIPSCTFPNANKLHHTATPQQRLEMLRLATAHNSILEASDIKLQHSGSRDIPKTVQQVRKMYPEAEIILLLGADMFVSFLNWEYAKPIYTEATICAIYREEEGEKAAVRAAMKRIESKEIRVCQVNNPTTPICSTAVRRMLALGCAEAFLPLPVARYIHNNKLYGAGCNFRGLSEQELEAQVIFLLKKDRIAHVLGCRDTAVALAKTWGADVEDAARAALLHDVTKALDGPLQLTLCKAYGIILDNFFLENPKTLHALTGSYVAQRIFGEKPAVVSAIRSHTTGKADMNMLEKIIYVADYMEPNRRFPGVEKLRKLAFTDIDHALIFGLEMTLAMLKQQGREISPESAQALAFLKSEKGTSIC